MNKKYDTKTIDELLYTKNGSSSKSHERTSLIRSIKHRSSRQLISHLTRRRAITRRDIERGVHEEEIPRPQQQGHRLGRHDREVLGGGEMRDAEGMPEDDVGVVDADIARVLDPGR